MERTCWWATTGPPFAPHVTVTLGGWPSHHDCWHYDFWHHDHRWGYWQGNPHQGYRSDGPGDVWIIGNDTLRGGPGNDLLIGGPGKDVLDGGPGKDKLIDWSGKYDDWNWCENKAWHKTKVDLCAAWLGHFVGDCAQPLHVTKHHHGCVGENPKGYATNSSIHSWIDGGYFSKTVGVKVEPLKSRIRAAKIVGDPYKTGDLFQQVMAYLLETHKEMEPLYELEKAGKLTGEAGPGQEGRAFLDGQLVKGGQMLGDPWYSACQQATEDKFLIRQLTGESPAGRVGHVDRGSPRVGVPSCPEKMTARRG